MKQMTLKLSHTLTTGILALAAIGAHTQTALPLPVVTTIAGIPAGGASAACTTTLPTAAGVVVPGDGCMAAQATLNAPYSTAVDSFGNVYWGDYNTYALRVIYNGGANLAAAIQAANPAQTIVPKVGYVYTIAGSRTAAIASTQGANGKAYYCNSAGTGQIGLSSNGDNCPATYAYIKPRSIQIDPNGNIFFVSASGGSPVRVIYVAGAQVANLISLLNGGVTPQVGYIYTIVKSGTSGYAGDGTLASSSAVSMVQERDVTLDSKGDIFVSDGTTFTGTAYGSNNNIRRVDAVTGVISTYAGSFGCTEPTPTATGCPGAYNGDGELVTQATLDTPYTIFTDQYDNLYITDDQVGRVRVVYQGGTVPGLVTSTLQVGHIYTVAGGGTLTATGSPATSILITTVLSAGIDNAGNIWFVDGTSKFLWRVDATTGIATIMGGGKTSVKGTACNSSTAPVTGPIATDSLGDGCAYYFNITANGRLAFDKFGNMYEVESTPAVLRKYSVDTLFPATAVGSSSTQWVGYTSLSAITPTAENFTLDGVASTQFSDAGSGTCPVGTLAAANAVCTINIKFTPTQASARHATLQVTTATSTALTDFLGGTGVAANTSVDPASVSTLGLKQTLAITGYSITNEVVTFNAVNTLVVGQLVTLSGFPSSTFFNGVTVTVSTASATQFSAPITLANVNQTTETGIGTDFGGLTPGGVAVDAYYSAYISDTTGNRLVKVTANNGAATTLATGLSSPAEVAVDGLGNVYVADTGNNRIAKIPAAGGTPTSIGTGLKAPQGVAVDSQGNVYVADTGNNRVVEIFSTGGQSTLLFSSLVAPTNITVDSLGNLFVVDTTHTRAIEFPNTSEQTTLTFGSNTITPISVAADAAGDIYIADTTSQSVLEFAPGSVNANQLVSGLVTPRGLALDTNGSVYVADSSEPGALYANRGIPTTSFPNTNLNTPNTAPLNITNTGNAALNFTGPTLTTATGSTAAFAITPTASNGCSTTAPVALGGQCGLIATFTPTAKTSYTENVSLVTNAADASTSGALLTGTGVVLVSTSTSISITSPTSTSIYYAQSVTASISITASSNAGSAPTGTVKITVDGKLQTQSLPASGIVTVTLNPAVGIHAISASYSGDVYYASSSNSYSFTVLKAITTTALSLAVGQQGTQPNLTFTAKVSSTTAAGETGTVSFYNGSTLLATVAVNSSATATYTTLNTTYPAYTFSVCYNGDSNFAASTCTSLTPSADFTVVPSTSLTVSVPQGGVLTLSSNITPLYNYSGTITATCAGLPVNTNCRFYPTSLPLSGTTAQTFNTYIYTNVQSGIASLERRNSSGIFAARILAWPLTAGLIFFIRRRKRLTRSLRLLSIVVLTLAAGIGAATLSGCSATSSISKSAFVTPTGTSSVVVTFTDGTSTHTLTYNVTILNPTPLP